MSIINSAKDIGFVGRTPNLIDFGNNVKKVTFSLGVNAPYKINGEKVTLWRELEAWGKTAELIYQFVKSGKQIYVKSQFKFERWPDSKTGRIRQKPVYTIQEFELLGPPSDTENNDNENY